MALADRDTALTTQDDVKTYVNIGSTNTAEDDRIDNLILSASSAISTYCGRKFGQSTHTSYFDGDGTRFLYLPHYPITTPMSGIEGAGIWLDSTREFGDATKLDEERLGVAETMDYLLHKAGKEEGCGRVVSVSGAWTKGYQNIKVVWQGGYTAATVPDEVQHCALRTVASWHEVATSKMHARREESLAVGGGSISMIDHVDIPADIKTILKRWQRPWISA